MKQNKTFMSESDILGMISNKPTDEISENKTTSEPIDKIPTEQNTFASEDDILSMITGKKSTPIEPVKPEKEKPYTGAPMTQSAVLYHDEPIFLFGSPFIMPGISKKINTAPEDSMEIKDEEGITHYLQESRKPQKPAESVSEWLTKNLPNDAYYAPGGIASFFLHDLPKSYIDPIAEDLKRNVLKETPGESADKNIEYTKNIMDATRNNIWGLLEFVTKPLGVWDVVEDTLSGETVVVENISPEELLGERGIGIKFNDDGTPKKVSFKLPTFDKFKESWNRNPVMSTLAVLPVIKYGLARRAMRDAKTEADVAEANVVAEKALDEARALREEGDNIEKIKVNAYERIYENSKEAFETYKTEEVEKPFVQKSNEEGVKETVETSEVEVIKDSPIDNDTGIVVKPLKHPEKSVFFQDETLTKERTQVLEDIAKSNPDMLKEDPMLYHQSLVNEMNRWYHKLDDVDVELTRRKLSEFAVFVDELKKDFPSVEEVGYDLFKDFKMNVVESAKWARRLQQKDGISETLLKPLPKEGEKFGTQKDIKFYSGIPIDAISKAMKEKFGKVIPYLRDPETGQPMTKFRVNPEGSHEWASEVYNLTKPDRKVTETSEGTKIEPGKWEGGIEERKVTGYLVEGYNPLTDEWVWCDVADSLIDAKESVKRHEQFLKDKKKEMMKGIKLYSGIPIDEAYKKVKDYFDSVDAAKVAMQPTRKEKFVAALKKANTKFWSQSHNLKEALTDAELPREARVVRQMMINNANATSRSASIFRQFEREIWGDLSKEESKLLDRLIFARRTRQIESIKESDPKYKPKSPFSKDEAQIFIDNFASKEGISTERARLLIEKTDAYFDIAKDMIKQLYEAKIIDEKTYNDLCNFDYQRRQIIDIIDPLVKYDLGGVTLQVRESGIKKLSVGTPKQMLETDARLLLNELVVRTQNRIMANNTAVSMYELAKAKKDNPIVRIKEKGEKLPKGWEKIELFYEGEKVSMYMEPSFVKEWVTRNKEITYELGRHARLYSGSSILRSMATGVNVGFALKNVFRDFALMWIASQHYVEGVGWRSTYSPYIPVAMGQQLKDISSVASDVIFRKGIYEEMVDQGVLLDFLSNKDRVMRERMGKDNPTIDTILDAVHYLGTTSELLGRASLYKRALRKGLDKKEAASIAKDYLFFGDYGTYTKAIDTVVPYFGATMKATESIYKSATRNPQEFALKATQVMLLSATLHMTNEAVNPEAYAQVSKYDKERNFILPYYFKYHDIDGVERYMYFKIPKDQGQTFFSMLGVSMIDLMRGKEVNTDILISSLKNLSPVQELPSIPTIDALKGYVYNKDFWSTKDIWDTRTNGKVGKGLFDLSEEYTNDTNPALVHLGKSTGLSPERICYMAEAVFTKGNIYTDAFAGVTRELFTDMPDDQREMVLADMLATNSTLKGLIGRTDPLNQFNEDFEANAIETDIERLVNNRTAERLVEQVFLHKSATSDDMKDFLRGIKDKDERDRLIEKMKFDSQIVKLPNKRLWRIMYGAGPDVAAKNFYDMYTSLAPEKKEELTNELMRVNKIRNLITPAFKKSYREEILKNREKD